MSSVRVAPATYPLPNYGADLEKAMSDSVVTKEEVEALIRPNLAMTSQDKGYAKVIADLSKGEYIKLPRQHGGTAVIITATADAQELLEHSLHPSAYHSDLFAAMQDDNVTAEEVKQFILPYADKINAQPSYRTMLEKLAEGKLKVVETHGHGSPATIRKITSDVAAQKALTEILEWC
jgi:hypothetical protein